MPLNLNDLIKKAKAKGIEITNHLPAQTLRPWQQESVLFSSKEKEQKKPTTNRQQTDNKLATNKQHEHPEPTTNRQQTDNKLVTQPATQPTTNRQQTDNKLITKTSFSSLVGLQRSLVIFIYNECKIARSKFTENLTLEHISKTINTSIGCIKTTLQRLEAKGFIVRIEYKNGRGGWSKYSIPDQPFQEILQYETSNKPTTNWQQTDNKLVTQPATQPTTSSSSSSGINYLNTTTTGEPENSKSNNLSDEWLKIDIEPLSSIGFTKTHLTQIASQNILSSELVQGSIYAFDFDLRENNKAKNITGDPINFFMGILRKGKPYAPTSNYESPQDKAIRIYRERMREIEQGRAAAEKEASDLAYNNWFAQLTDEQKIEFLPEMLRHNTNSEKLGKSKILENSARNHFETEIWPSKKMEIVGKTNAANKEVLEEKT